jgi:hypothetical protein
MEDFLACVEALATKARNYEAGIAFWKANATVNQETIQVFDGYLTMASQLPEIPSPELDAIVQNARALVVHIARDLGSAPKPVENQPKGAPSSNLLIGQPSESPNEGEK